MISDLMGIKTVNPLGDNYNEIVDYLKKLSKLNFKVEKIESREEEAKKMLGREDISGNRINLIAQRKIDASKPYIMFYGHLDTVPVKKRNGL